MSSYTWLVFLANQKQTSRGKTVRYCNLRMKENKMFPSSKLRDRHVRNYRRFIDRDVVMPSSEFLKITASRLHYEQVKFLTFGLTF